MYLYELIEILEQEDRNIVAPMGFNNPHSYRGCYNQLAFEPCENITVGEMLECAKEALGKKFLGYKGGEYTMNSYTFVNIAVYGESGEEIGPILLKYMLGKY